MTIPMIPGWGDDLKENLPQLGQALGSIIAPQHMQEVQLREAIQRDPKLLSVFATLAKDNPDGISRIFGPNAGAFLSQLHESPDAQLARSTTGAAQSAMGDPTVARDAGLRQVTGQTSDQRRLGSAQATNAEMTVEQKQLLKDALGDYKTKNPEAYGKLSQIGALREYLGTDENSETIKENQAQDASSEMAARGRVDTILKMNANDIWAKYEKGEIGVDDLGSAFTDPRAQGLKIFFDQKMKDKHDAFMLEREARMDADRDARAKSRDKANSDLAAQRDAAADARQQARLDAAAAKAKEDDKTKADGIIRYNNSRILSFTSHIKGKDGKRLSREELNGSLPLVNDMLARNHQLKEEEGPPPEFVTVESGGFLGMGKHPEVVLRNGDGTLNSDFDKITQTTTAPAPSGHGKTVDPKVSKVVDSVKERKLSKEQVQTSPTYKALTPEQQKAIDKQLGY